MYTSETRPAAVTAAVRDAVLDGAWTSADVVATVASAFAVDRASILATLWDLVDDGALRYDAASGGGFRPPH